MDWDIEAIKALAFTQGAVPDAAEVWHLIGGAFPENAQKRGLPLPLLSTASGIWNDVSLNVVIQPTRIEISLTGIDLDPNGPEIASPISSIDAEKYIALMRTIASNLLGTGKFVRFAAATQLVKPVADEAAGVKLINSEIGDIFPEGTDSILFQLNKPIDLVDTKPLRINRLCKWGVQKLIAVGVGIDQSGHVVSVPPADLKYRAYMHIDVNNATAVEPFDETEAAKVVEALWREEAKLRSGGFSAL